MKPVVTLTLNPSIDVHLDVEEMAPTRKLRATQGKQFPGGGGINVSRVIKHLAGSSIAVHTAGWSTGQFLRELVEQQGLLTRTIPIQDATRTSVTVFETGTGQEFRVTPAGPHLTGEEWRMFLEATFEFEVDYIVATGSLPPGVPEDFYARVAKQAREHGIRTVLDTSGPALSEALREGVYLVKPNLREMQYLLGSDAETIEEQEELCRKVVEEGWAEVVALTLGEDGAILATRDGSKHMTTPKVKVRSAVGAGDSFVGGMTLGLARGMSVEDAFAVGLASGTAAVISEGTELCRRSDVDRLFVQMTGSTLKI